MAVSVKRINNATVDHAGAAAVEDKVRRLLAERTKLNEQWRANVAALKDAVAAGRLFGVEVTLPPDIGSPGNVHSYRPRLNEAAGNLFEAHSQPSIRECVLAYLKAAGDAGAKTADIRREIEKQVGHKLHEKTIGMTLYRLSLKGQSKREGLTWFYVPSGT